MSILSQTFFPFMSRHFMSLSFLSTRHVSWILRFMNYLDFFTAVTKVLHGLNAGIL